MNKPLSPARYMFDAQLNYLVDAGYARIFMQADCRVEGVIAHRNDDIINFAIQANAVKHFISDEKGVSFECRLEGRVIQAFFPWDSIIGIFPPEEKFLGIPNIQDPWGIGYISAIETDNIQFKALKQGQERSNPLKEVTDQIWPPKETKPKSKLKIVE